MAQYLTFEEYQQYGGTLSETDFTLAEFKARSRIDWITLGRVQNMKVVPEEVKLAMMCIIKVDSKYSADAQVYNALVASFSTDGYSESYGSASEQARTAQLQANEEVTKMLFGVLDDYGVPLVYKGLS